MACHWRMVWRRLLMIYCFTLADVGDKIRDECHRMGYGMLECQLCATLTAHCQCEPMRLDPFNAFESIEWLHNIWV